MTVIIKFDPRTVVSKYLPNPLEHLLEMVRGKSVLNVGACGDVPRYNLRCEEISFYTIVTQGLPGYGLRRFLHDLIGRIQPRWAQNLWVVYSNN